MTARLVVSMNDSCWNGASGGAECGTDQRRDHAVLGARTTDLCGNSLRKSDSEDEDSAGRCTQPMSQRVQAKLSFDAWHAH